MSAVKVRANKIFDAIQSTDPEVEKTLRGWLADAGIEVNPDANLGIAHAAAESAWFLFDGEHIAAIHAADFLQEFDVLSDLTDPFAQFEAAFAEPATVVPWSDELGQKITEALDSHVEGEDIAPLRAEIFRLVGLTDKI